MLASPQGEQLWNYWQQQLAGELPILDLPTDRLRPPVRTDHGASHSFKLIEELTQQLKGLAKTEGATLYALLLAAFQVLLHRYTGQEDILVGSPTASRSQSEFAGIVGYFVNPVVLRSDLSGNPTFKAFLSQVRSTVWGAIAHQDYPFPLLVERLQPNRDPSRSPLFQVLFEFQKPQVGKVADLLATMETQARVDWGGLELEFFAMATQEGQFDLTLEIVEVKESLFGSLKYNTDLFDAATITRMAGHFQTLLEAIVTNPEQQVSEFPLLKVTERHQLLVEQNDTQVEYPQNKCIHQLFEAQVAQTPDAVAVVFEDQKLTYQELNQRANCLAYHLHKLGVTSEVLVGIYMERCLEMVVGMLGILKAGGAYLPLDPEYPKERLAFMLKDAQVPVLLTQQRLMVSLPNYTASVFCLDRDWQLIAGLSEKNPQIVTSPDNLAYTIYTSGSTGKPKGVMVCHRNVVNFFTGMDGSIGDDTPGTWLAVTSISFDISVLELLWTLTRGFQVVIHAGPVLATYNSEPLDKHIDKEMAFSLFYFASDELQGGADKYKLLLEGAKFADQHGFSAIWTPERHFHAFGGIYPNPSVISAAIAAITERIQIRAGSVVLPLQNPIRVAEEWSVIDNLSQGRVGISFASGWHANDFVLAPDNYTDRSKIMFRNIETVRKLWRGESVRLPGGNGDEVEVKIHPQPLQPELPTWVTAAGSPETFRTAGQIGANVLTHLMGQSIEELKEKIAVYRQSWKDHGHEPGAGHVTLMIHTFVGEDIDVVREKVRQPFCQYLKSFLGLLKNVGRSLGKDIDSEDFTKAEEEQLLAHAFNRYFENSSLFGTPSTCLQIINKLKAIGVDEVGCLIDFGVDFDSVLSSLHHLNTVRELSDKKTDTDSTDYSLPTQIIRHHVSHMQCTPSMARMLTMDTKAMSALNSLRKLMLGGEALPISLAEQLRTTLSGEIYNMYGPTETTIWSATHLLEKERNTVSIGRPIANTKIYILDRYLHPVPIGFSGELYIGGEGVVRGYLHRPDLTAERFIHDPFGLSSGNQMYKTGDLARYLPNGDIDLLGRIDNQVKIRGFRIELGEIEAVLAQYPKVQETVVIDWEDHSGNKRLVAYIVPNQEQPTTSELQRFLKEKLPNYMVPSAFVMLSALPLTPNGKIDRRALPAPDISSPTKESSFISPRDTLEQQLVQIWEDVLDTHPIGVRDNFFDLGGHSLLALRLVAQIQQQFGKNLPLATLFRGSTIEQLADILRKQADSLSRSPLVAIQPSGSKRPFFCLPGAGGNVINFYDLARYLGSDQPFYGLQAANLDPFYVLQAADLDSKSEPYNRIEDIAFHNIRELQTVQPQGPYLLGGHSGGGLVAFEMAQQLQKQGHKVALVAILDEKAPISSRAQIGVDGHEARWVTRIARIIKQRFPGKNLEISSEALHSLEADEQLNYIGERLKMSGLLPSEAGIKQVRGFVQAFKANYQAQVRYMPQEIYPTRITLLRASEVRLEDTANDEPSILRGSTWGWSQLSVQPVEVHVVPGDHFTMMAEPHVQVLAERLRVCLDQVQEVDDGRH